MIVLVVGGTADGRHLATRLHELGVEVIYSIAGIGRKATLPCTVVSGGFTQFGGLAAFMTAHQVGLVIDVTHPFAQQMSNKIIEECQQLALPTIRFHRPAWQATAQDHWVDVESWSEVITQVTQHQNLLLTAGQIEQAVIDQLAAQATQVVLRTAMPVKINLPSNVQWIKAIGPFQLAQEKQLLAHYQIDALISKNSGGASTYAKIQAAADANVPVYQFKRPTLLAAQYQVQDQQACVDLLAKLGVALTAMPPSTSEQQHEI